MVAKIRILIADNDVDALSRLYLKLVHKGVKAEATDDAEEILARISRFRPHVLLLSPAMLSGCAAEFCRELKIRYRVRSILMLEGSEEHSYPLDIARKPVDADRLLELISLYR